MATLSLPRTSLVRTLARFGNGIYRFESAAQKHREMLRQRAKQTIFQLVMLGSLFISYFIVGMINSWSPGFFEYSYFGQLPTWETLTYFWPLGLWCLILCIWPDKDLVSSHLNARLWFSGLITGNLAGIWEEIGYRYLYICFAMLWLVFFNWLLGTALMWLLCGFLILAALGIFFDDKHDRIVAIFPLAGAVFCLWLGSIVDPIYWFYDTITMPLLNWVSFGSYATIISDSAQYPTLLVMGGILANFWFRDGHKYQGWFGYLDSWMVGFVLLYAMFTYGLLTAIVIHCMWNTTIYTSLFIKRSLIA